MKKYYQQIKTLTYGLVFLMVMFSCQKMERPALGDFAKDPDNPGGTLNFYAAFDGVTNDPIVNAVDSIKANFPTSNPLASVDGISGKAVKGESQKSIKYARPNDWATKAKSFTISFWMKHNGGQTKNNKGTNGPEHIISIPSSNGHWSGSTMLVFLEGSNAACAVKVMIADRTNADNWFTWEGGETIANLLDNNWHHIALVYDAGTSVLRLYKDGVANSATKSWANHGNINLDNSKISEFRVGAGPNNQVDSDDWLASSFKGTLDQLRLYSVAISAAEVSTLYNDKK
jgi:hypothetical protein